MLRRARRCRCNCLMRFFELRSGAGRALLALLQIIGRFPLSREWGMGGSVGFFWSVCGLFVVAFLFFRFRFFTLTFFSHFHFFSHTPTPHTPPFPRKRESPCDARRRRGIRAFGAELGDSRFRGNGKGGGVLVFFFGCLRTLCCRVFVFSLPFFHTYIFLALPLHTPPIPAKAGISL